MIRRLTRAEEALPYVAQLLAEGFLAPMLETREQMEQNLLNGFSHPSDFVLAAEEDGRIMGVFSLMAEPEEHYLEMLLCLSRSQSACEQVLAYLAEHYPGHRLDCVIHPTCIAMVHALADAGGCWEDVSQKLRLVEPKPHEPACSVIPCDQAHRQAYIALHHQDVYWTAERVLDAPARFVPFVAVENGQVIGYLDVTIGFEENEVYDWFVLESCRERGVGKALLDAAIRRNGQRDLTMLCSESEQAAIHAAHQLGFAFVENAESMTGSLKL